MFIGSGSDADDIGRARPVQHRKRWRTVKSKFPLAGMFLRPATPSNSLPESPHNSLPRLFPLPKALYDRQCFKRAAASTVGPAPTENFGAAFEAIPATLIVVDAALRTISATSFSIAGFREGPALWLCSIAGPTVVPATTQVVLPVLDRGHSWGTEL